MANQGRKSTECSDTVTVVLLSTNGMSAQRGERETKGQVLLPETPVMTSQSEMSYWEVREQSRE